VSLKGIANVGLAMMDRNADLLKALHCGARDDLNKSIDDCCAGFKDTPSDLLIKRDDVCKPRIHRFASLFLEGRLEELISPIIYIPHADTPDI